MRRLSRRTDERRTMVGFAPRSHGQAVALHDFLTFKFTSDVADRMKDSIRAPIRRWTNRLAIATASLVCLTGCVGPARQPGPMLAPSAPSASVPPANGSPTINTLGASPAGASAGNPVSTVAYPSENASYPGVTSGTSTNTSPVVQAGAVEPHVSRQFPSGGQAAVTAPSQPPSAYQLPPPPPSGTYAPPSGTIAPPTGTIAPPSGTIAPPMGTTVPGPGVSSPGSTGVLDPYAPTVPYSVYQGPTVREADLVINGFPARTGRIMLGGAVNSDAGVTGQLTIDERNFDITRWPRSFQDMFSGTAFRGAGQTFRLEAAPGSDFQRYTLQFADPNLLGYLPISMSVSGFLFDRRFVDWDEQRLGGRLSFGYRITPDLSISAGISGQNVEVTNPRVLGEPQLDAVLGDNELWSGEIALTHDTRDSPIQASSGHYFQFKFEEVFGDYNYARFETELRQYWLLTQRADGSGKQTLSYSTRLGFSGDETPLFENFFAGGYATLRGFDFRGASPVGVSGVEVGGQFQWLNSVEYMFPITADDAFRGVGFVDFGTVEEDVEINSDSFRVAPGLGLRVAIPMLGPAPLAFDFAYPVAKADTDNTRIFSFYMSLIR